MWIVWSILLLFAFVLIIGGLVGYKETKKERFPNYFTPTFLLVLGIGLIILCFNYIPHDSVSLTDTSTNTSEEDTEIDNVYYSNCTDAREAGVAPIYKGEPGYRVGLDRDRDGIACER
ncbi:excalibur calcium-binding domain-containing protein [Paenibacillus sp. UKAQ_18]|nr:excalibur calcium-binding domain-containing protein [Paenibacillus sp. UKAQ_18]